MSQNGRIITDNTNLEKESCYAFVSDIFDKIKIKMAFNCYNANNLHKKLFFYQFCLTYASIDQPDGYSTLFY